MEGDKSSGRTVQGDLTILSHSDVTGALKVHNALVKSVGVNNTKEIPSTDFYGESITTHSMLYAKVRSHNRVPQSSTRNTCSKGECINTH